MKWQVERICEPHDFKIVKTVNAETSLEAKQKFMASMSPSEHKIYFKHLGHKMTGATKELTDGN